MKEFKNRYRVDIQALRGIAVFAVLLFHAKQSIFPLGYLGVDVFFVISGFVVTPLILRIFPKSEIFDRRETLNRLRAFFLRRFFRLAPALGTSLILAFLLVTLLSPSWDNRDIPHQAIATLLLVGNWGAFTFIGDYFHGSSNPIVHTWSLSAEEQIYILIPLFFFFLSMFSRRFRKSSILKNILLLGITSFVAQFLIQAFSHKYFDTSVDIVRNALFYSPISRVWEFSIGAYAYSLGVKEISNVKFSKGLMSFGIVIVSSISLIYFLLSDPWPLLATMVALGIIHLELLVRLPKMLLYILAWVGDRSYSIYLVHLPLIYVAKNSPLFGDARRQLVVGIALVLCILIGSLMFSLIENRFRTRNSTSIVKKSIIVRVFATFVVIPLITFISFDVAISHSYWGAINIPLQPINSLTTDNSCQSFNSLVPCVHDKRNANGGTNNILVGDSHADSLSTVFAEVATAKHESFAVWTKGNCPFILRETIKDSKYKEIYASLSTVSSEVSCLQHNQEILDYVRSQSPIRVWLTNRNTQGYRTTFSWNISSDSLRNIIEVNFRILSGSSFKVIYIGPVPEKVYGDVPAHRLLWELHRGATPNFKILDLPSGPFDDNRFFSKSLLMGNVDYINTISVFCNGIICTLGKDNQFYLDSHHLNIAGSEKLKAGFEAASL